MEIFICEEKIKKAERVLIDNGIEEDEASTVLQALGYVVSESTGTNCDPERKSSCQIKSL